MAAKSISETKQTRYLLGLSFPAEREHIESEYFEDEDAFQEMLTAEDDLIDAYARGELVGEERRRFEKSFVSSLRGRDRVQFARAFAGPSTTRPVETKLPGSLFGIFKVFQWSDLLRTATIAAVIVFVSVLAWLVIDRRRMTNELRELRTESAELIKRTAALQQNSDTERTRTAEITAQLKDLRAQPDKPRNYERGKTADQRALHLLEVKNDRERTSSNKPELAERLINAQRRAAQANLTLATVSVEPSNIYPLISRGASRSGGSTVRGTAKDPQGNVVSGATVTLIDSARNFIRTQSTNEDGAYVFNTIPPGTYSIEVKAPGFKTALASGLAALVDTPTVLDMQLEVGAVSERVDVTSVADAIINTTDATLGNSFAQKRITELPLNANNVVGLLSLQPSVSRTGYVNGGRADQSKITLDGVDITIPAASFPSWIRYQTVLETAAIYEEYRVTINTVDGRPVTSLNWIEPLAPNQTIIDTPVILIDDLPAGDYVLVLMGKETDGSFVKVAEYSFTVIKY